MKYLNSEPFSSKSSTDEYRKNFDRTFCSDKYPVDIDRLARDSVGRDVSWLMAAAVEYAVWVYPTDSAVEFTAMTKEFTSKRILVLLKDNRITKAVVG